MRGNDWRRLQLGHKDWGNLGVPPKLPLKLGSELTVGAMFSSLSIRVRCLLQFQHYNCSCYIVSL